MNTPPLPGVNIVVVNYKTPGDLRRFCDSVARFEPTVPWTLTVVNVCPEQEDLEVARWAHSWGATTVAWKDNVGYARACNAAALTTAMPVLALFNADIILTAGAIDECVAALSEHPTWGVLGPRQVDDDGRMTHGGIFGTHARPEFRGWRLHDQVAYTDVREAVTVSGSAYFVKRRAWEQLTACPLYQQAAPGAEGAFLPTPHYFEETFCSYHAHAHGWQVMYFGPVKIVHRWHKASPVGGWAEQQFPVSQSIFRVACDVHEIEHD